MKDKMRSFHLAAVIGSLPVKAVKWIRCGSLHLEAVMRSLPVKAVKTMSPSTLETFGKNEIPLSLKARRFLCGSVLCDDGHELSSLLDQVT